MSSTPNALCFGEGFPSTGIPCHVQISRTGLTVRLDHSTSDTPETSVPFSILSVAAGGLNHDQLVIRWKTASAARTLYLKDPTLIRSFREAAPYGLARALDLTATNVRQERGRRRTAWAVVIGILAALALIIWMGANLLVEFAVSRIPVTWEQTIGEAAYRDFLARQTVIKDGTAVTAIREITQRLTEQIHDNPYTFQVSLVKSDVVNAFALPGGYVIVFTGLLKKAERGEEVAGVLSHELNHVLLRHGLDRLVKQLGLMAVVAILLGDQQGLAGLMGKVGVELMTLKFSRAQESEADLGGVQLLHRAKIDPAGIIDFFERLSQQNNEPMEILSTHPMSQARADRLKAEVAAMPKQEPQPFEFDWKVVQEALEAPGRAHP